MDRINLQNMAFYGYHGNLPSEIELGQRFFVDISMALDVSKALDILKEQDIAAYQIGEIVKSNDAPIYLEGV